MHGAGSVVATMRITEIVIDVSCLVGCLCVFVWGDKEQERSCADVFFYVDRASNRMLRVRLCQDGACWIGYSA